MAFVHNVLTLECIAYTAIALLVEVNTIFLHIRKLMQLRGVPFNRPAYRVIAAINLLTFAVFRGYSLFRITWGMYWEPEKISYHYYYMLVVSMFIMNILNPILFYILLRNDFLRSPPPPQESVKNSNGHTPAGIFKEE